MDENQFRILMLTLNKIGKSLKELSDTMSDVAGAWVVLEERFKKIVALIEREEGLK